MRDGRESGRVVPVDDKPRDLVLFVGNQRFAEERLERHFGQGHLRENALLVVFRRDPSQRIARALGARLGHQVLEAEEPDRAAAEGARIGCHGFLPVLRLLSPTRIRSIRWRSGACIVEKDFGGTMSIRTTFVSSVLVLFAAGVAAEAGAQQRSEGPCEERSEEHTSELQSPDHLLCRLLLEKKK